MFFPFTFTVSVPGIMNPFANPPYPLSGATDSRRITNGLPGKRLLSLADRPHPSSLPPPVPLARKRGWQPSSPEPSPAVTDTTSTKGHLNVRPGYRDSTVTPEAWGEDQGSEMADGRYFCIADCAYILSFDGRSRLVRAPVSRQIFTAVKRIIMHVAVVLFTPCFLLMATTGRQCTLCILIYTFTFFWGIFILMFLSFHVCLDFPPAKRRRTLARTIASGALNAALIGTAVGLTVYRLWKDRGKVLELEPPPYEQGNWVPARPEEAGPSATLTAPKKSHSAPNTIRRGTPRHRRVRTLAKIPATPPRLSRNSSPQRPAKIGSDVEQTDELEDRMDWMGGRLTQLIEDGKKALGKEIVVMSEVQEDEEDDGNGNWEEEADPDALIAGPSRSGSVRHRRHQSAGTASSLPAASPRRQHFSAHSSDSCPIPTRAPHDYSPDATRLCASFREEESDWQSSELRKSMERARAAYLRSLP